MMEPSPSPSYCFSQSSHVFFSNQCFLFGPIPKLAAAIVSIVRWEWKVGQYQQLLEDLCASINLCQKRDKMDQLHELLIWCLLV